MDGHGLVSNQDWLIARKEHLAKEKEFTHLRDQLSQQRRELPWETVDTPYVFDGPDGKQLIVFTSCLVLAGKQGGTKVSDLCREPGGTQ